MKKIILLAAASVLGFAAMAQPKFAHVNIDELVQLMPETETAMEQLESQSKEAQETYQAMMQEFQDKYTQYQQKQDSWTPAVKQSKERELAEIQNRIQEFESAIQTDLQQLQNNLMAPIYQKVQETIDALGKEGGYIYVFNVSLSSSQIVYIDKDQSTDLMPQARKALGIPEDRTLESLAAAYQAKQAAAQK